MLVLVQLLFHRRWAVSASLFFALVHKQRKEDKNGTAHIAGGTSRIKRRQHLTPKFNSFLLKVHIVYILYKIIINHFLQKLFDLCHPCIVNNIKKNKISCKLSGSTVMRL